MSTASRPSDRAIVFIDIENVGYGFVNTYHYPLDWQRLLDFIQSSNPNNVIIAFAKFHSQTRYVVSSSVEKFLRNRGVIIRPVPENQYGKQLSDIMIINALWETAIDVQGQIKHLVLVSGDGDFAATLRGIKDRFDYTISVYALRNCLSSDLIVLSDNVYLLDSLHDDPSKCTLDEFLIKVVDRTRSQAPDRWFTFSSLLKYAQERRPETVTLIESSIKSLLRQEIFVISKEIDHGLRPIPRIKLNTVR